ncbi:TMEM165/GDT1 family protein [Oscillatoria sp. HE19RPO]|uniref:TMEM165/GDT1 family protein n=1 Tax=Oscillatoria sp. HE19RPO TaxID=2954806 RepID=UPI0020C3BED4|nr:TMEM165/GDT1 family protein [Oscillatoria sp. HE19RPO]
MDWQLLGVSFITIFLAELGDKSQVAAIALGGSSKFPQSVFFGTAGALVLASLLGVLAGEGVAQLLPAHLLKAIAAIGFAIMALRLLFGKEEEEDSSSDPETPAIALSDTD